jgi:hypothetical protein
MAQFLPMTLSFRTLFGRVFIVTVVDMLEICEENKQQFLVQGAGAHNL